MARFNRKVVVDLVADTSKFSSGMRSAGEQAGLLTGKLSGAGAAGAAVGAGLVAGTALVGRGIAESISAFASYEDKLNQSMAIMGDLSEMQRTDMSDAAREVAKTTRFSAEEAAESYFFLASAGLDAEQSIAALPTVARFAQAGMFDLATATDLATDAQSALGLTVPDAAQNLKNLTFVTDVLVKSNTLANTSVQQVSEALTNKLGASLRAANIPLEEGVAVLAAYADQGLKGAAAGEGLGIALRDLKRAASENEDAFRDAGIQVFDAQGNFRNLADIVEDVDGAFADLSVQEQTYLAQNLGFQDRSFKNIQLLFGTADAIREYERELRNAGGTTEEIANKQLESLSGQMDLLKSSVTDAKLEVGEGLAPAFKDVIPQLEIFVSVMADVIVAMGPSLAKAAEIAVRAIEGTGETLLRVQGLWNATAGASADFIEVMSGVRRGMIDISDPADGLANIMWNLEQRAALTEENFYAAADAVGATEDQMLSALYVMRDWLVANDVQTDGVDAWILSLEAAGEEAQELARWQARLAGGAYTAADGLDDAGDAAEDAAGGFEEGADGAQTLADKLNAARAAQESLSGVLKAAADPVFAAVREFGKYRETLAQIDEDGKRSAEEQLELAEAILGTQTALDALSGQALEDALDSIGTALDMTRDDVVELLNTLGILDGTQVEALINVGLSGPGAGFVEPGGNVISSGGGTYIPPTTMATPRAEGGPVDVGQKYLVGERGPEIFIPATSGTILPNEASVGRTVQINFNNTTMASDPLRATRAALALDALETF